MNAGAAYLHYLHGVNPLGKVYLSNMAASVRKIPSISSIIRGSRTGVRGGTA